MFEFPLPCVSGTLVGSESIQVTDEVMSCGLALLGNVALAVNVIEVPGFGARLDTVRLIEVGVPSVTVMVAVAAVAVLNEAVIVVVQTPEILAAGLTRPAELMVAQDVLLELHDTLPVRSFVDPSL